MLDRVMKLAHAINLMAGKLQIMNGLTFIYYIPSNYRTGWLEQFWGGAVIRTMKHHFVAYCGIKRANTAETRFNVMQVHVQYLKVKWKSKYGAYLKEMKTLSTKFQDKTSFNVPQKGGAIIRGLLYSGRIRGFYLQRLATDKFECLIAVWFYLFMFPRSSIVPAYSFGEMDLYNQIDNPSGSMIRNFQEKFKKLLGFAPVLFYRGGIFNYSFGFLPHRRPINTVCKLLKHYLRYCRVLNVTYVVTGLR